MNTESQQQIAQEAAEECSVAAYDLYRKSGIDTKSKFLPIILSAIERATSANNAALTAAYKRGGDFAREQCANEENEDLVRLEQQNLALHQQLLSALAAIEKHNHSDNLLHNNCCAIDVDLSLMHEHDAEVRKPLVEVLLGIRAGFQQLGGYERTIQNIDDALAKVKQ